LLPFLENELNCLPKSAENDNICQGFFEFIQISIILSYTCLGLVVLIGTLAQYIKDDDSKVRKILARLIQTLSTPSQQVQESVASCLPALVPSQRESSKELIQNLMILLTNAECYGERRGAAYGIFESFVTSFIAHVY
jgi:hypothetical protein